MTEQVPQSWLDAVHKFAAELGGEDELGAVIRGHLHVEGQLNKLIEHSVKHPQYLPNLEYADKVALCIALGVRAELRRPLEKIGEIRNRYAHKSDYQLPRATIVDSMNSYSDWFREQVYDISRVMGGGATKSEFNRMGVRAMFQAFTTVVYTFTAMEVGVLIGEAKWKDSDA